jgi:hypothetical protein
MSKKTTSKKTSTKWLWVIVVAVAIILVVAAINHVKKGSTGAAVTGTTVSSPTTSAPPPLKNLPLTEGSNMTISGRIAIEGANVDPNKLKAFLRKQTNNGRGHEIQRELIINGHVPSSFQYELLMAVSPQFIAHKTEGLAVTFTVSRSGFKPRPVKVQTGDFVTTIAYVLCLRNAKAVVFRGGNEPVNVSAVCETRVFRRTFVEVVGDTVVGGISNFVPVPDATVVNNHNFAPVDIELPQI